MNGIKLQVFETLPEVTVDDVGIRCLHKNKEWVVLPNGEWWPSVGYKEWFGLVLFDGNNTPTIQNVIVNDFSVNLVITPQGSDTFITNIAGFISSKIGLDINIGGMAGVYMEVPSVPGTFFFTKNLTTINSNDSIITNLGLLFKIVQYPS
jgi:hypothetical protein